MEIEAKLARVFRSEDGEAWLFDNLIGEQRTPIRARPTVMAGL